MVGPTDALALSNLFFPPFNIYRSSCSSNNNIATTTTSKSNDNNNEQFSLCQAAPNHLFRGRTEFQKVDAGRVVQSPGTEA